MKKYSIKNNSKKAFSIIEVLLGIFVFALWMVAIFGIISSTVNINDYNKNYIIASNLASEQLELVKNIRDSNYVKIQKYNQLNPATTNYDNIFEYWNKYTIENDYSTSANFPIKVIDITEWFEEWKNKLNWDSMQSYKICIDSLNRYTYNCNSSNKKTEFYKYISIEKVKYNEIWTETEIENAFLIKSKVIWYKKWYHEFEVKSIIADWKRL